MKDAEDGLNATAEPAGFWVERVMIPYNFGVFEGKGRYILPPSSLLFKAPLSRIAVAVVVALFLGV
jgi:hypothetical protein